VVDCPIKAVIDAPETRGKQPAFIAAIMGVRYVRFLDSLQAQSPGDQRTWRMA